MRGTGLAYTVDLGHAFFQAASYDGDQVLIEISAERFMPADRALAPGSHKRLMQLGFSRPTKRWPNWWIAMEHSSDDELLHAARATTTALLTVYEMSATEVAEALGMPAPDREQPTEEAGRDAGVRVQLRAEERPDGSWLHLWASLDDDGNLHLDGQDLGPVTRPVSPDGEYEYVTTIAAVDVPRFVELAGGTPGHDVLRLLADRWSGPASFELERMLRASDIPVELQVW